MVHGNNSAHTFLLWLLLGLAAALGGCAGYVFNINENPVYNPPTLFTDYRIVDGALGDCVEQTIADQRVTQAGQLTRLNCSSAGIEQLTGLSRFSGLKALSLADNRLTEVDELKQLTRLEILILRDNDIVSAEPLLALLRLKELDLRGNDTLACGDAHQLADGIDGKLRLPKHCD